MKKIIVWILLICMKLTALSSCHTTKQPSTPSTDEIGGDMIQVEKDKLVIVRPETVSQTVSAELRALKSAFQALSGRNVEIVSEKEQTAAVHQSAGMTEILVGLTDRSASKSVYDALPNAGYSISYRDGAIVIGGTNDAMLIYAVRLFSKQCVAPCAGKDALTVSRELSLQNAPEDVIALIEEGRSCYSLAYSADVDYMPNADYANNGLDIEVGLLLQLQSKLQALTTEKIVNSSTEAEDSARREVLIGTDGRMEFATAKKQWAAHEYGVLVVGNKLVVSAWSDAGLQKAVAAFSSLIDLAVEEKDGKTTVRFIKDHLSVCSDGAWITDIPAYEGGTLSGANDAAYGQYLQLITQTNAEEYRAYFQVLERAGYTKYLSNQIGDNLFATYVKDNVKVHTYYTHAQGAVRIITGDTGTTGLISAENTDGTRITDSALIQMGLNYSKVGGMGYVITLEDGRFVVIDGGCAGTGDAAKLYNLLKRLNKRQDGIVIAAWILTHEHGDHYGVLENFWPEYATLTTVQNLYVSIPSESYRYNSLNPSNFMEGKWANLTGKHGKIPVTVLHTGQTFKISNVTFEILYTTEDLYPQPLDFFNDASVVLRADFGTGEKGKVLFLGDIADRASEVLCGMYGNVLKTYTVQVSHHGWNGATLQFYTHVGAKVLLWPNSQSEYNKSVSPSGTKPYHTINRLLVNSMGVEKTLIADAMHHRMTFDASGIRYDTLSFS